jgi:hypothetical protein
MACETPVKLVKSQKKAQKHRKVLVFDCTENNTFSFFGNDRFFQKEEKGIVFGQIRCERSRWSRWSVVIAGA